MQTMIMFLALLICATASTFAGCRSSSTIPPAPLNHQTPAATIPEAQTVAFCELVSRPDLYDKKTIRVQAIAVATRELAFLYDPECNRDDPWIDFGSENEQVSKTISPYLDPTVEKNYPTRVKVTVVGRFDGPRKEGYGHLNSFRFHFLAIAVEQVAAVDPEVPGPWAAGKSDRPTKKR